MRVIFLFIQFIFTYVFGQNQQVGFVYNSIPYKSFDVHSINGTSSRIKVSQQTGIAIVALGNAGIMIIDNKFNTHIHQSPDKSYIQCVQISKNGQYIFLGMVGQVGIFQLDQIDFSIKMINSINVENMTIIDIQFNLEEEIMFVVGYLGVLKWYDSRNIINPIQLGIIDYSQYQFLFNRGAMPPDDRFFYIAADFEGLLVFRIDKSLQNNQLKVSLTKILTKLAATSFTELVVTSKNNYVFTIDRWNGIFIIYDLSQLIIDGDDVENKNNQLIKMVPANLGSTLGYTSSIGLSLDDQFLYVGARSLGILIYNIQDPLNPQFFQQLQLTGQSFSIALSPKQNVISNTTFDNQFIYYSNSLSVAIYQKQKPSLFNNIPNLFNSQQSQFFIEGTAASKWRCAISSNNKYFLAGIDADGLSIFEINVNSYTKSAPSTMQIKYQFNDTQQQILSTNQLRVFGPNEQIPLGFSIDNIYFSKDGQYIYFAAQQSTINIIAYKFKVIISPDGEYSFEYVKGLHYDQVYYCEEMNFSEDEQHAVMSFDVGIVLVDMVKFEVISMYTNQGVIGTCCGAVLSHDKKHALAVVRNVGLFIYDTSDMANPKMVNQWRTNGGETLLRSQVNQIIYFLDGFNGIILLDSTKLPEIVVIGSYISSGWTNFISFTNDERYGIISTMDSGTLTLIDLTDKSNLRVIMKSTIQSQNSITTCVDKTGLSFLFSMNQHQFRLYNLQSQVQIHVERQVQSISTLEYTSISDIDPFQVGLQYLVRFVVLYRQPNQVISQIYYYQNLVLQSLPSWMTVDRSDQSTSNLQALLQLNIPKECLDSQAGNKSFLTIVIQSCFQLDVNSFIFETTELITTLSESTSIFNYLKQSGYIDGINCATNFFDSTIKKYIDLSLVFATSNIDPNRLAIIQSYVTETFKRTIVYNQFVFDVVSSLQFDQSQKSQMIQAIQKDITVSLAFQDSSQYNFIQKTYPNLVMYFNDQLTVMKIEGDLSYVNQALSNGILYFDKSKFSNQTYTSLKEIQVAISDNFNYNLNLNLNVESEVKFLKLKSDIVTQKTLQDQMDKQGTDLTIEQSFMIQFDIASFIDPDQIPLSYQFQQKISGQFVPISSDSFIKCDNVNLRLVGNPPSSYLFSTIYLRLQVTNGYTTKYDYFYININKMPFSYVLNILIQVLGPLAFAFGLYKKRASFMNLYFKNQTMYSTETAYVNQIYRKKILILDQDYEIAYLFLQKFMKQSGKNFNQNQLNQGANKLRKSILNLESAKSEKIINSQQNIQTLEKFNQVEGDLKKLPQQKQLSEISQNNSNILRVLNKNRQFESKNLVNQDESFSQSKKQINETIQSQYGSQIVQKETQSKQNSKIKQNSKLKKEFKDKYDTRFSIQQQDTRQKKQSTEQFSQSSIFRNAENKNNVLNIYTIQTEDGTFQMNNLFNQMIQQKLIIQYELLDYKIEDYALDLQNEFSRFYQCLKANVLRHLLEKEKKTLKLYQFLKKYSLETGNYLQNDWYKQYVQITATNDLDQYGVHVPFSKTTLIEDEIFKVLKDLEIIPKNLDLENYQLSYLQSIDINPYLLKEVLFADALGLNFISSKAIIKCCGESIHLEKNQVVSVEAFEKIQDGVCLWLRKLFNLQYKTLPISKYISLPSWMSYEFKNGVVILEGIPIKSDVNNFLIRVYDQTRFVCYQFHLNVVGDSRPRDEVEVPLLENQIKESNFIKENDARLQIQSQQENMKLTQLGNNIINNSKESLHQIHFRKQQNSVDLHSIKNQQNQTQNQLKNEQEENVDEIEEKAYTGIRSMTEYYQELTSPPIFPLALGIIRNTPLQSFKLNTQIPDIQSQEQFDKKKQKDSERDELQSKYLYEQQLNQELYDYSEQQINKQHSNQNQI
ncbi:two component regulator propeller family protein (macronuclear) [Tetrahymena thermophila SB210]|uniref:Two component regulator propeller family protein n=1 Tax=Tetrahymena thermophila (strain SB210) TaxID=312017 RepID=Q22YD2_TETTS|nr:two component regulator propeller family protein [Tetrahymena thermophila SB210]EAR90353.4 two component regulator propeller family protein [Tetrahymena thermophila SB210]|eukprot:XP_001010598.4 two component regulator propeller family protein [Tetrahymena thermophila SB210]